MVAGDARAPRPDAIIIGKPVLVLLGQQSGERRKLYEVAGERVEQADAYKPRPLPEQNKEALGGVRDHVVVSELREIHLDELASGGVEEAGAVGCEESFLEHDPLPGMETAVQAAVRARVRGAPAPVSAHGAEADVVGDVVGEEVVGDQPRRSIVKSRPVSPITRRLMADRRPRGGGEAHVSFASLAAEAAGWGPPPAASHAGRGQDEYGIERLLFHT